MQKNIELKQFVLCSYDIAKVTQKTKVKLLRKLYGYKNKKKKTYHHEGLTQTHQAEKINSGVLLIPAEKAHFFSTLFQQHHIPFTLKEVFIQP